jgi:hypothetical protein
VAVGAEEDVEAVELATVGQGRDNRRDANGCEVREDGALAVPG